MAATIVYAEGTFGESTAASPIDDALPKRREKLGAAAESAHTVGIHNEMIIITPLQITWHWMSVHYMHGLSVCKMHTTYRRY